MNYDPFNYDLRTPEGLRNAVAWQTALVERMPVGGVWIVPRSMSLYTLHHDRKLAVKTVGFPEPDIQTVFEAMGWRVEGESGDID